MKLTKGLFQIIKAEINQGTSLSELITHPYLRRHFTPFEIEDFYNQALRKIEKKENAKKFRITFRMSKKLYDLIKNSKENSAKLIRTAILEYFAKEKPLNCLNGQTERQ